METPPKVLIIGAGLAGSIASGALAAFRPVVYEARPPQQAGLKEHTAVMRIRDPQIGSYLGCQIKPIKVTKEIFSGNRLWSKATLAMVNEYSLKISGRLAPRSLKSCGEVKRWLLPTTAINPSYQSKSINYHRKLTNIYEHSGKMMAEFEFPGPEGEEVTTEIVEYDFCISTIPLPVMAVLAYGEGWSKTVEGIFHARPVLTYKITLPIDSEVHQTIYFPDDSNVFYRATIEGKVLTAESTATPKMLSEYASIHIKDIFNAFGIYPVYNLLTEGLEVKEMPFGKIWCTNGAVRQNIIYSLTKDFSIYSLGRFAIWKPIRADHLVKDLRLIQNMVSTRSSRAYALNKTTGETDERDTGSE